MPPVSVSLCLRTRAVHLLVLANAVVQTAAAPPNGLSALVHPNGSFHVRLGDEEWFDSGDISIRRDWSVLSLADGSLAQLGTAEPFEGSDDLGRYNGTKLTFSAGTAMAAGTDAVPLLEASVRQYADGETLVFRSHFPTQLEGTAHAAGTDKNWHRGLSSIFPSFRPRTLASGLRRGYATYDGWDCRSPDGCLNQGPEPNPHVALGAWDENMTTFPGGLEGSGPIAIFTADGTQSVTLSAFDSDAFMVTSSELVPAARSPPTPAPPAPSNRSYTAHVGAYCAGSHPAFACNNCTLEECQARCDASGCPCFDYRVGWPAPQPYCQNCRVAKAGAAAKVTPSGQNYTTYVSNQGPAPPPAPRPGTQALGFGVMASVSTIPAGFATEVIVSTKLDGTSAGGTAGIGDQVRGWGAKMLRKHNKTRANGAKDFTNTHLGFDTDNGAYYYYNPEPGKTYADTLLDVHAYAQRAGIPYRHVQIDSWWYIKGKNSGTKSWTPGSGTGNLTALHDKTGWPVTAHNRMWSPDVTYALDPRYDWHVEPGLSLPLSSAFWHDLFRNSSVWGLYNYEQDWLYTEFVGLNYTLSNATAAATWLDQMGAAADAASLTMQFCMAWPRFVLHSLRLPAVTQARASADYAPGNEQWRIGLASLFIDALGLRPTKDSFWTEDAVQRNRREPYNRLQSVVSTLSTGPVFPSGSINHTDVALVMRSCRADGALLQPTRAAAAIDKNILARAGVGGEPGGARGNAAGETWASESVVPGIGRYSQLLSADAGPITVTPADIGYGGSDDRAGPALLLAYESNASATGPYREFSAASAIHIDRTDKFNFTLHHIVPVLSNGWALLGEAEDKWVPVSTGRFTAASDAGSSFSVKVTGSAGETVTVLALPPKATKPVRIMCGFVDGRDTRHSSTMTMTLRLPEATCTRE